MIYTNAELHYHTSEASWCGQVSADDGIRLFRENGYDLVCVTDHYNEVYFPKEFTNEEWRTLCGKWLSGWYAAKEAGEKYGVAVIHGAEFQLNGHMCEFLVYGVTDEMFLSMPALYRMNVEEIHRFAVEYGLFVAIAHPFRREDRPDTRLYDAAEIFNVRVEESENARSREFAAENKLIPLCCQDFHKFEHMHRVMTRFEGEVRDLPTMIDKLRKREYMMILPEGKTIDPRTI